MVIRRNTCARAIRSAAPEAAIPGMRAAGTSELRPLWRSRKAISRAAVSCERTFAVFETAGVRARWLAMLRRSPPFARTIASASVSSALSMSSGGSVEGRRGRARRSSFHGVRGRSWAISVKGMTGAAALRRERDGAFEKIGGPHQRGDVDQRGDAARSIVTVGPTTETARPSGRRASERVGRQGLPPFQSTGASLSTASPKAT